MPDLISLADRPRLFVIDDFASGAEIEHALALGGDPEAVVARGVRTTSDETGFAFEMSVAGEPEAGGDTFFPRAAPAPVSVRPRRGRLAAWFSHRPDGSVEELSWHEGLGVEAGTKTTLTSFDYRKLAWAARLVRGTPAEGAAPDASGVVRY